jgi:hypothetical protein
MNRIVITVEGGVVQGIAADHYNEVVVCLVDFDTEGADDVTEIPALDARGQPTGHSERAVVDLPTVEPMYRDCARWFEVPKIKAEMDKMAAMDGDA